MNRANHSSWGRSFRPAPRKNGPGGTPAKKKSSRLLWPALFALAAFLGGAAYFYFSPQGPRVGIEFFKPQQILAGEQFEFRVSVSNFSDSVLKNSRVSLYLPDGVSAVGQSQSQRVLERAMGDLGPGSVHPESFDLIVTRGDPSPKRITAKVSYSGGASGAEFESSSDADIAASGPAIDLAVAVPESVSSGQDFEIKVSYANNTNQEFKNVRLKLDYPPPFTFKRSAVPAEDAGDNSWNLGDLAPGSSGVIAVTGNMLGSEGSSFGFAASLYADFLGSSYNIGSREASSSVASAPLSVAILVNGSADYVSRPGDELAYSIAYKNNSSVIMQDVAIRVRLVGEMFDLRTVSADGAFNQSADTITWSGATAPELLNVPPGGSGLVSFKIKTKDSFPIRQLSDKNFTVRAEAQIESKTVPAGTGAEKTVSVAKAETKISGRLFLGAEAFWRDAASGILNQGPYPLKVNQSTQITVHWAVKNFATDVNDVVLSAFLGPGVRFTGKVKSNIPSEPTFSPGSGLVTWNVGTALATKGVLSEPIEAVFQIEVTPTAADVGNQIVLLGETKIQGTDAFTGARLLGTALPLSSDLPYDTTITETNRAIQP